MSTAKLLKFPTPIQLKRVLKLLVVCHWGFQLRRGGLVETRLTCCTLEGLSVECTDATTAGVSGIRVTMQRSYAIYSCLVPAIVYGWLSTECFIIIIITHIHTHTHTHTSVELIA